MILLISIIMVNCTSEVDQSKNIDETVYMDVSFNFIGESDDVGIAYTDDHDSLWSNKEWKKAIKQKMKTCKTKNKGDAVILFDNREHCPNVQTYVHDVRDKYYKYQVANYWKYSESGDDFFACPIFK